MAKLRGKARWLIVGLLVAAAGRPAVQHAASWGWLLRTPATLQAQAAAPPADLPRIPYEKFTLPNGLDVILSQDHRLPLVAVNLWYHVGPVNEAPGRTGFAHLFEHMMFQGSRHVPPDSHFRLLQGVGATDVNGTTDFDRTNYFETVPAHQLELALWIESDRMGYLLDRLDARALANQQDVVRNERRQSHESRPYAIGSEALTEALYPPGHPYHGNIIGSHADIQAAQLDDVRAFFTQYYRPNNASLAIAGDFDPATVRALVEKYFGPLERGAPVPAVHATTPPLTAEVRRTVTDRVELPRVYLGWLTPPVLTPGDTEGSVAAAVLAEGRSSRLYRKLVYELQVAQDVVAFQEGLTLGSRFVVIATARRDRTIDEVERAVDAEVAALAAAPPSADEVERARTRIETSTVTGLERLGGFGGVSDVLNAYNHHLGNPGYLPTEIGRLRAVTPQAVQAFARDYLRPTARAVVRVVPGPKEVGPVVPTPPVPTPPPPPGTTEPTVTTRPDDWRSRAPGAGTPHPLREPPPQSARLPNGLTLILTERKGLPVVAARLVVKGGSDNNPVDRPGLAAFTAALLDQGTASRSALQIASDAAQVGASMSAGASMDTMSVTTRSLARHFPRALDLLADVALHPSFPTEELERQRSLRVGQLAEQRQSAAALGQQVQASALYGQAHPYGYTDLGTEAAVKTTTREEVQSFWARRFVPGNAALVVAGDISLPALTALATRALGSWSGTGASATVLATPSPTVRRIVVVDKPGAPQTQLRVAALGAARSTPDYAALRVLNEVLGGLFSSRINMNLRERHGYTYSAGSQFTFRRGPGPFSVAAAVRTDVTAPALTETLAEMERLRAEPMTADELRMAKEALTQSLPGAFETSAGTVATFADVYVHGLGLNYFTRFPALVNAVTAQQAREAAIKYLAPERLVVIAVGDRSTIEPELRKLNVAPVQVSP